MRKNREQQKIGKVLQLDLFKDLFKPVVYLKGRTCKGNPSGVELLSQLEKQRTLTVNLLETVVDYGNLIKSYQRVRQNKGSRGVDPMEVDELGKWLEKNLNVLCTMVLEERYQVNAVRKVMIQKTGGGERMLGIPTVKDRMLQQAIHQVVNRYYRKIL